MGDSLLNNDTDSLKSALLSTLDELTFFSKLSNFLKLKVKTDIVKIYIVLDDLSLKLVSIDGKPVKNGQIINKGLGISGYVVRTKSSYFSNNTQRDPLFLNLCDERVKAELCVPILISGKVIATINFQSFGEIKYSREDITLLTSILKDLYSPLANIKMYLSAKLLGVDLEQKIKQKDKELEQKIKGLSILDTFIVTEPQIIGKSKVMVDFLKLVDKCSKIDVPVVIEGEKGSGKDIIAQRIHTQSNRSKFSFVSIDCSLMKEEEISEELFGKTLKTNSEDIFKRGLIELSDGGTLVIHNISELTLNLQSKIAQCLKNNVFFKMNETKPEKFNSRIIGTTTKNLQDLVNEGKFREDLFFLLTPVILKIPSLRERKEDIQFLSNYFLNNKKPIELQKYFSPRAMRYLLDYNWPMNIQELKNVAERAYILSNGAIIDESCIPDNIINCKREEMPLIVEEPPYVAMTLEELERKHIEKMLYRLEGNKTKTAKALGITVKTLYNKLHDYNLFIPAREEKIINLENIN